FIDAITGAGAIPEFECFDTGIVRSVGMYRAAGMFSGTAQMNFVMGVASGQPARADLLPILADLAPEDSRWQVTAIGRAEIWPLHRRTAELGGHLRTGLEDTFYLPDGAKVTSNGALVEALARTARDAGRDVASPAEARAILGI
ncbi:3-keto-5-aminohexanoate cleavage protein, partial [Thalassovita aquimarina]